MTRPTNREWAKIWNDERTSLHGRWNLDGLPFCIDCCTDFPGSEVMNCPSRCFNCGRNMRHRKLHSHTDINCFCSLTCKEVVLARRRVQKERKRRRTEGAFCASCSRRFVPRRGDATTCSSACRQRMYRLRALQIKGASEMEAPDIRNGERVTDDSRDKF
jgi:hypothetical protein